ncbi:hypothetical protein LTR17_011566 [Elasticomyces elasticus]|nr:hypothetical protein LTR17_011566 [Elasticomyces elasticus]
MPSAASTSSTRAVYEEGSIAPERVTMRDSHLHTQWFGNADYSDLFHASDNRLHRQTRYRCLGTVRSEDENLDANQHGLDERPKPQDAERLKNVDVGAEMRRQETPRERRAREARENNVDSAQVAESGITRSTEGLPESEAEPSIL